jgi:outer membrane receptor for ferric coprogen and ferric-rhodotorulic acid
VTIPFQFNIVAAGLLFACAAHAQSTPIERNVPAEPMSPAGDATLSEVSVTATGHEQPATEKTHSYTIGKTPSATGLNLSMRETPQSVSVVTREQMDDFGLGNVNDVLENTTGVIVEKVETNRTYYTARGFDITNFQVDGVGIPFVYGNVNGDIDTVIYDRVEVVRGANGLVSGTGNPSATVNFVRKRPTADVQGSLGLSYGSWANKRIDGDLSGPLNEAGTLRGRLIVSAQDKDSYLDRYSQDKTLFYGIVEADISDSTTLAAGHTREESSARSPMWGALPLYFTDGTPTDYDVSTSTAADWARWKNLTNSTFVELTHRLANDWQIKTSVTHSENELDSKLFYVYGTPDRTTGAGLFSYPSLYEMNYRQDLVTVHATGPFELGGRKHELVIGGNWAKSRLNDESNYGVGIGTALPDLATWNGDYPEPAFTASVNGSSFDETRHSLYAATRLNPTDALKLILGANATSLETRGVGYDVSRKRSESKISPYVGVIYDLSANLSAYGSYTDIFNPQHETDINHQTLAPVEGNSKEIGLKGEFFDKALNASIALFKTAQKNTAETAGYSGALAYYEGIDTFSEGVEIDLSGKLTSRLQASAGYTQLSIKDKDGDDARTYVPRKIFRVSTTYRVPTIERLKIGATVNWRDDAYRVPEAGVTIRQSAYALLNLMARYDFTDKVSATLNLNNVTDRKYISSLYWDQGYYGAPRNATLALNLRY